jgi:hypothetical protein
MDAKYLHLFDDLRRTLATRRWSLGTGCNEEHGIHGLLQGVVGRRRSRCSCSHDIPGREFTPLVCHVGGPARGTTGKDRHVRPPRRFGLRLRLRLVFLPLFLLEALGIEWVGKPSLLPLLDRFSRAMSGSSNSKL